MPDVRSQTWLVTGCSSGLGRAIAEASLAAGDRVVVTARNAQAAETIAAAYPERALPLALDVCDGASVTAAIAAAERWAVDDIDVLVNNAAYGLYGAVEEVSDEEMQQVFQTNFFGVARVTQKILTGMRQRKCGTIVNIGSIAGVVGGPGNGFYAASKFALEGISEALRAELAPLGIRVILLEPSGIRTDFHGRSYRRASISIEDYKATAGRQIAANISLDGRQAGDPMRIAQTLRDLVALQDPPFRLLLGASAVNRARTKLRHMLEQIDAWETTSRSIDFDS